MRDLKNKKRRKDERKENLVTISDRVKGIDSKPFDDIKFIVINEFVEKISR